MFLLKKCPYKLLLLPELKSDSGFGFSQIFDSGSGSGSERKMQNPSGVDSGTPDPWPPAGVTFSDSDSAPVQKFLNPCAGPAIFQIWESDSCSDSGYNHPSNRNLTMLLLMKWPHRLLLLPKLKRDSGTGFSQIFDSGSGFASERNAESCLSRLRHSRSGSTSAPKQYTGVKRNFRLAKFLTSGLLRMRRPIFQIRNFASISGVWVIEIPDHLFRKHSVSVTAATEAVYWR